MPKSVMTFDALSIDTTCQQSVPVATTLAPTGTTVTVDWNNGNHQTINLGSTSNNLTAITFSNPKSGSLYSLTYIQHGSANRQAPFSAYGGTWNMPVPGYAPKITSVASAKTRFWVYYDGAAYWLLADQPMIAQDLTELAAIGTGVNGQLCYVVSEADVYALDVTNSYTPDALTVIAAAGAGYWVANVAGRWEDLPMEPSQGSGGAALSYVNWRDTPYKIYTMNHGANDELHFRFQIPHRWRKGTDVKFHIHESPTTDPASTLNAYFIGQCAWLKDDTAIPANAGWTTITPVAIPIAVGDVYVMRRKAIVTITPPSGAKGSDIVAVYLQRNGANVLDTYLGNLAIWSSDLHIRVSSAGSVAEAPT